MNDHIRHTVYFDLENKYQYLSIFPISFADKSKHSVKIINYLTTHLGPHSMTITITAVVKEPIIFSNNQNMIRMTTILVHIDKYTMR